MVALRFSLLALCIKCMKLIVKYFFIADVLFVGGCRKIWINTFSLGRHVLSGGRLRLESPGIQVNMVYVLPK
jgi:hypothetical protein